MAAQWNHNTKWRDLFLIKKQNTDFGDKSKKPRLYSFFSQARVMANAEREDETRREQRRAADVDKWSAADFQNISEEQSRVPDRQNFTISAGVARGARM